MRFEEPEPKRILGLAWRSTSPRKSDFNELGKLIIASN
jgi:LysR family hydrogen peroxide-inducible transcriptional activator